MRIGILTGGGDVPGLNPCIKAVVTRAEARGWNVLGFRRGWAGPLNFNPDDEASREETLMPLSSRSVRRIDRSGGTVLHTSRTNPGKVRPQALPGFLEGRFEACAEGTLDCTPHVLRVIEALEIDALIAIGGDDTLSYAARLHREGVTVMSIPKTMDNDVFGTDYCIGFSTAVSRSIDFINALRTTTGSHERIAVVELFGRNSGETSLISGYLASADRTLICEVPFNMDRLAGMLMADRAANPSNYAVVVISEGARLEEGKVIEGGEPDAYGHRKLGGIDAIVSARLQEMTGVGTVNQSLAYLMRSGAPDSLDRMVAGAYGTMAVQLLEDGERGRMMALSGGKYTTVESDTCIKGCKRVDVDELYDAENYRPRISNVLGKPMFLY